MTPDGRIRRAIVLSGGSVYAAYEVGVLKALIQGESSATGQTPLNPNIYVGTSGGAFNAAVMASQPEQSLLSTIAFLENVWLNQFAADARACRAGAIRIRGDVTRFANLRCLRSNPVLPIVTLAQDAASVMRFFVGRASDALSLPSAPIGRRALEFADPAAVLSNENYVRIMRQVVSLQGIRESDKVLGIATTNWRTGELRVFTNADLTDQDGHSIIQASNVFPGIAPVMIGDDPYVDGGYVLNTPLQPAIDAGADELHVVFMDPDVKDIPLSRFDNIIDVLDKFYHITQANLFKRDISLAGDINAGLDVIEETHLNPPQLRGLLEVLGRLRWPKPLNDTPLRKLAIHLYHPRAELGGPLGILNFDREHVLAMIAQGYADAVTHDCVASGCVLPKSGVNIPSQTTSLPAPDSAGMAGLINGVVHA